MTPLPRFLSVRGFIDAALPLVISLFSLGAAATVPYVSIRGHREWNQAQVDMTAAGYSFDPKKLVKPEVPAAGNFGATPAMLDIATPERRQTSEIRARVARLKALNILAPSTSGPPDSKAPRLRSDRPTDWKAWRSRLAGIPGFNVPVAERDDARAVYDALCRRDQPLQDEFIAAARARKNAQITPRQFSRVAAAVDSRDIFFDTYMDFRGVTPYRLFLMRAEAGLACGQREAFSDLSTTLLAFNELADSETSFIGFVAKLSGFRPALYGMVRRNAGRDAITAPQLGLFQEYASALQPHLELRDARLYELLEFIQTQKGLSRGKSDILSWTTEGNMAVAVQAFLEEAPLLKEGNWLAFQKLHARREEDLNRTPPWMHLRTFFGDQHNSGYAEMFRRFVYCEMERRLFIAGCALERHRLAGGKPPAELKDLPRNLLPSVPLDLDDKPLRYKVIDGRPVIWSIGLDLKDDWHGNPPATPAPENEADNADWQWSLP